MSYVGPLGIPHSHFLGGPAVWSQDDRDKALAWQDMQRQACRGCGTRPEEWSPSQGGKRHAYRAETVICLGCAEIEQEQERGGESPMKGRQIRLAPTDD